MKQFLFYSITATILLSLTACKPSASDLQKVVEEHPEIVFAAIEKNPDKFMEVVQRAAGQAQQKAREKQMKDEQSQMEDEFKNPKTPDLSSNRAWRGLASAPITIVEYSDFQCPYCSRGYQTIKDIEKKYGDKVRVVFKHLPLDFHKMAMPAAKRFEAIALQDAKKAYAFHDALFQNQARITSDGEKFLDEAAKKVGADMAKMKKDMDSDEVKKRIEADMAEAKKFDISGTPGFIVGGISVKGAYPVEHFDKIIEKILKKS